MLIPRLSRNMNRLMIVIRNSGEPNYIASSPGSYNPKCKLSERTLTLALFPMRTKELSEKLPTAEKGEAFL